MIFELDWFYLLTCYVIEPFGVCAIVDNVRLDRFEEIGMTQAKQIQSKVLLKPGQNYILPDFSAVEVRNLGLHASRWMKRMELSKNTLWCNDQTMLSIAFAFFF